jgi:hypothetical protein
MKGIATVGLNPGKTVTVGQIKGIATVGLKPRKQSPLDRIPFQSFETAAVGLTLLLVRNNHR